MRKHLLDRLEKLIPLAEVCNQSAMVSSCILTLLVPAPTVSPKSDEQPQHGFGANPYRMDHRPQQDIFDLDLDLNPDL